MRNDEYACDVASPASGCTNRSRELKFLYAGNLGKHRQSPPVEDVRILSALIIRMDEKVRHCGFDEGSARFRCADEYAYMPYLLGRRAGNNRWNDISLFIVGEDDTAAARELGYLAAETAERFAAYHRSHVPTLSHVIETFQRKLLKDYNIYSFLLNISPISLPEGWPPLFCVQKSETTEAITAYFYYLYGIERYSASNCQLFRKLGAEERKKLADVVRKDRYGLFKKFIPHASERSKVVDVVLDGDMLFVAFEGGARMRFPVASDAAEGIELLDRLQMDQLNELASRQESCCIPLEFFESSIYGCLNRNFAFHSLFELFMGLGVNVSSLMRHPRALVTKYRRPSMEISGTTGLMYIELGHFNQLYDGGSAVETNDILRAYHGDIVKAILYHGGQLLNATGEFACALYNSHAMPECEADAKAVYSRMIATAMQLFSLEWDVRISIETIAGARFLEGHIGPPDVHGMVISSISSYIVARLANTVRQIGALFPQKSLILPCDVSEDTLREVLNDTLSREIHHQRSVSLGIRTVILRENKDGFSDGKKYFQVYQFSKDINAMDGLFSLFKDKPDDVGRDSVLKWRSPLAVLCHLNSYRHVLYSADDIQLLFKAASEQVRDFPLIPEEDRSYIMDFMSRAAPYADKDPDYKHLGLILDMGTSANKSLKEEYELSDNDFVAFLKEHIKIDHTFRLPASWPFELLVNRRRVLEALTRLIGLLRNPLVECSAESFTLATGEKGERFHLSFYQPWINGGKKEDLRLQFEDGQNLIAIFERKGGDFASVKNDLAPYFDFIFERFDGSEYVCLSSAWRFKSSNQSCPMKEMPPHARDGILSVSNKLRENGIRFTLSFTVFQGGMKFPICDMRINAATDCPRAIVICYRKKSVERIMNALTRHELFTDVNSARGFDLAMSVLNELDRGQISLRECRIAIIHKNNTDKGNEEGNALRQLMVKLEQYNVFIILYTNGYVPDGFQTALFGNEHKIVCNINFLIEKIKDIVDYTMKSSLNRGLDELINILKN